ncbi:MAG: aldolase [Telmatospirillum sp.]|nr:aldolase [Telmatospirillum sp.]
MTSTLTMGKAELMRLARDQMQRQLTVPDWTPAQKVAATCRILFSQGHDSGLAGQITARLRQDGHFLTQRLGLGFDEISPDNLLTVDEDLAVIEGPGMPNPANRFHSWIYRARPDVRCIIHTHPLHASALSMLGRPLTVAHMDSCLLYGDVAFLKEWPGVPVGNSEGSIITEALGDKRAVLLAHHGLLVAARSVEEACVIAVQFEKAARMQLLAEADGEIRPIPPDLGAEAHDWLLHEQKVAATFHYYARRALRDHPDLAATLP